MGEDAACISERDRGGGAESVGEGGTGMWYVGRTQDVDIGIVGGGAGGEAVSVSGGASEGGAENVGEEGRGGVYICSYREGGGVEGER